MAKFSNNVVMGNVRGMVGGQVVFKTRGGKMYVSAPPEIDENRVPTPNQQRAQGKFKRCIEYAKAAVRDPATRDAYLAVAEPGQTAYNMALKDAYKAPEVIGMITQGYRGEFGNIIVVQAKDDFSVAGVKVAIYDGKNKLIEEGPAMENGDGLNWVYTATRANANTPGTTVKAIAVDLPGNEGELKVTLQSGGK